MTELPAAEPPARAWDCPNCVELRAALADAIRGMTEMLPLVNEYRRRAYNLDVYLTRALLAFGEAPETPESIEQRRRAEEQITRMQLRLGRGRHYREGGENP